jgi:hypothetical protein
MLSADRGENMSGIERLFAAIFLAGAVAGAAAFGHLLGNEQASVPAAISLSPALRNSPSVAIEATPAPPLPSMIPARMIPARLIPARMIPAHLPTRVVAKAAATQPTLRVQAAPKPIVISRIDARPAPVPAKAAPRPAAAPTPTPAPAPAPTAPVAAPTAPAPVDVQVVLAATEQVVAPQVLAPPAGRGHDEHDDQDDRDDHEQDRHGRAGHERAGHERGSDDRDGRGWADGGGANDAHNQHGHGNDN